jgi:predicted amidohydrolase
MVIESLLYNESDFGKQLTVACATISCDREPASNRQKIIDTVNKIMAQNPEVELIVFGEMILGWYNPGGIAEYHRSVSERISQETLSSFIILAKRFGIYLCLGMSEIEDGALFNSQVLLNPSGEIQAVHRKSNLKQHEREALYRCGEVPVTITDISGVRTGIVICSDAANPGTVWKLMRNNLDLIILSLADDRDDKFFMARANARMYDAWIVTANRYGSENGRFWNGHTVISDPLGRLRVVGQDREQNLIYCMKFAEDGSRLRRIIRKTLVRSPLIFYILVNWRKAISYF